MTPKDLLLALLVIVVWGLNFVVIKVGLHGMPPMLMVSRWSDPASGWRIRAASTRSRSSSPTAKASRASWLVMGIGILSVGSWARSSRLLQP